MQALRHPLSCRITYREKSCS